MLEVRHPSNIPCPPRGTPYKARKTRLCRRLLNAQNCDDHESCSATSHDPVLYNSRKCRFGPNCRHLARMACTYYHPRRHGMRVLDMTAGLGEGVVLEAFGDVDTTFERYGIRGAEKIASFNFLDDGRIAVPGLPPILEKPRGHKRYSQRDHELTPEEPLCDHPRFAPLLRATSILRPDVQPSDFHVTTTAGCLKRLAHFLLRRGRPERLDLEYRDGTLYMARWAGDVWSHVYLGFGKQFEDDARSFAVFGPLKGSTSSHAVVACEMGGGLRVAVQSEVDAMYCTCHTPSQLWAMNREKSASPTPVSPGAGKRRSSGRFDVLSLVPDDEDERGGDGDGDDGVVRVGIEVGLECSVEIKTRARDNTQYSDFGAQLYFQQVGKLFLATYGKRGFLEKDMVLTDVAEDTRAWEEENQLTLARMVALLKDVRRRAEEAADSDGTCTLALVMGQDGDSGEWRAVLYRRTDGASMLPPDF